jgi:hypothetical protein
MEYDGGLDRRSVSLAAFASCFLADYKKCIQPARPNALYEYLETSPYLHEKEAVINTETKMI